MSYYCKIHAELTSPEREDWHTESTRSQSAERHAFGVEFRVLLRGRHLAGSESYCTKAEMRKGQEIRYPWYLLYSDTGGT